MHGPTSYDDTLHETICAACNNYHKYRVLSTRHYHTTGATTDAVNALVIFHLNYWNSLPLSLPSSQTARLRVQCRQTCYCLNGVALTADVEPHLVQGVGVRCRWVHGLAPTWRNFPTKKSRRAPTEGPRADSEPMHCYEIHQ